MRRVINCFTRIGPEHLASLLLATLISIAAAQTPACADSDDLSQLDLRQASPSAQLSAARVVSIQMSALGQNGAWGSDQGIAVAFRFASPSNRRITGPLERFVKLVANPVYAVMLDHKSVEVGEARKNASGDVAQVPVLVTSSDNERVGFVFTLSLQTPGERGESEDDTLEQPICRCWMTDSVSRVELPKDERQSI